MKQTAVDWLVDQLIKQGYFEKDKHFSITNLDHLVHQAKEMEKQQINPEVLVDELLNFQIYLNEQEYIDYHSWEYEKEAKYYVYVDSKEKKQNESS
jgi:hypothetical protein